MKKTIRLRESELTNLVNKIINEDLSMMKDELLSAAEGMSEAEKGGLVKLIKECIAEFDEENPDFSRDMKVEAVLSGLILLFIFGAILLDFDIAAVLGAGGLVMLGNEQVKKWKKVIECAKNKKNNVNNTMEESIMKKTIRLTESELINLVQRIIKEDEMMGMDSASTEMGGIKGFAKTSLKELLSNQKELSGYYSAVKDKRGKNIVGIDNDYKYYKGAYPDVYAKITGGKAFEPTPGGFGDIRPKIALEKVILMKEGGKLMVSIESKDNENIDTYTLSCKGGKVTITGGSVGP